MSSTRNVNGWSLPDLLVELLISSVVFGSMLFHVGSLFHATKLADKRADNSINEARLYRRLSSVMEDLDTHRFDIPPVIHFNGGIRLRNGAIHPLSNAKGPLRPLPGSDAISSLTLFTPGALIVKNRFPGAVINICRTPTLKVAADKVRSYIAIGIDGIFQATVTRLPILRASACVNSSLSSIPSLFFSDRKSTELADIRLLIPVLREYTLFIDSQHQLRYAAHVGSTVIENQPIGSGYERISLRLQKTEIGTHKIIRLISRTGRRDKQWSFQSHISREPIWNTLLNF